MAITSVLVVSVPVSDQDRARDFYVDVLGFELLDDVPMGPTMRWVQVRPRGAAVSLTLVTWFPSMTPGSLKGLVVESDDVDLECARLLEAGLDIPDGVQEQAWGRFFTFDDPDGNGVVVRGPRADVENQVG